MKITRESILERLVQLQYERSDFGFHRSTFRVRGDTIDLFPAYMDTSIRMVLDGSFLKSLEEIDPLTGQTKQILTGQMIYPAKHFMTDPRTYKSEFEQIQRDKDKQVQLFKKQNKLIEAHRLEQKVTYDLEMIQEMGYVNGIENYLRYFDGRKPGDPPNTLLDYYKEIAGDDWLLIIDESHMTVPQTGMYNGDRSRKHC